MRLIPHIHKGHSGDLPGSLMNRVTDEQRKTFQGYHLRTLTHDPCMCERSPHTLNRFAHLWKVTYWRKCAHDPSDMQRG